MKTVVVMVLSAALAETVTPPSAPAPDMTVPVSSASAWAGAANGSETAAAEASRADRMRCDPHAFLLQI